MVTRYRSARDEEQALLAEFARRGLNPGPAAALSATPEEFVINLRRRLAAETTPGLQESRAQARSNVARFPTRPLLRPEMAQRLPGPLRPLGMAAREFTSPASLAATLATAGAGPAVAGAIRGGTGAIGAARGVLAAAISPIARGPLARRLAAEFGTGVAGTMAAQGGSQRGTVKSRGGEIVISFDDLHRSMNTNLSRVGGWSNG